MGGRERRREGLILSEESSLHHTGGGLSGKSRESKCPLRGILRDCNARGRNLAGKGGAGHIREGAGFWLYLKTNLVCEEDKRRCAAP